MLRTIFIYAFMLLSTVSYAKYENLLHRSYADRYEDIDITFFNLRHAGYDSNRYFKEIAELEKTAKAADDYELYLEARWLHTAYYRNGSQRNPNRIVPDSEPLLAEAIKAGNKQIVLRTYLLRALYYYEVKKIYAPALYNFLHCYDILSQLSVKEFPNKKEPLTLIGTAYYTFGDYVTAKKILRQAENTNLPLRPGSQKGFIYIKLYNALGALYRQTAQYDTAVYYFNKGYQYAVTLDNKNWMRILKHDIAVCFIALGNYDKALALIDVGLKQYVTEDDFFDEVYDYCETIGYARLMKHDYSGAWPYLKECRRIIRLSGDDMLYERMSILFRHMAMYQSGIGNKTAAYMYADSALVAEDSSKTKQKVMELARIQEKMQQEQFENEMAVAEADKKIQLFWRNASMLTVALLSIIVILFINRQGLKHKQKRKLAEQELENASLQLKDFTNSIHEKNKLIEQITEEIERYQSLPCSNELPGNNEMLIQLQQSVLLTDEQWNQFKSNFEKVHVGFLNRLKQKLPDITPADTRFIVLSKLQLSNKEMASMLGVSLQAVRTYRYRLRKKLNLPEEGSIDELINMI